MLTTVTTVFGLLPLASNLSIDVINRTIVQGGQLSTLWVPLSQAIVSGLTFATLLTLVTTPAMLAIPHQLKALWRRLPVTYGFATRQGLVALALGFSVSNNPLCGGYMQIFDKLTV